MRCSWCNEENKKYNLTRIITKEEVYLKHFYDSLTITKIINIKDQSICDLGSGAGFPGLVLAICFPSTNITLIESNGKKCYFLNLVKEKLTPVLGEDHLIVSPKQNIDKSIRKFLHAIGR